MANSKPDAQTLQKINDFVFFTFEKIETKLNDNGEEKKELIGLPNWRQINKTNYGDYTNAEDKAKGILTGTINNITVLDFDNMEEYNKMVKTHPDLNECFKVKTKKGYHLYFNYNSEFKTTTDAFDKYKGVDIRNDGAMVIGINTKYKTLNGEKIKYKYEGGTIADIPTYMKDYLKKEKKPKEPKEVKKTNELKGNNCDMTTKEKIVDMIDIKYLDNFESWNKIVWAMKKENYNIEFIKQISMKSSKYDEEGFNTAYNKSPDDITISQGTLNYYARLSDETKYMCCYDYDLGNLSDSTYTNIIMNEISDSFIYQEGLIYVYVNNRWYENDVALCMGVCKKFLINYLSTYYKKVSNSLIDATDEYEQEKLKK